MNVKENPDRKKKWYCCETFDIWLMSVLTTKTRETKISTLWEITSNIINLRGLEIPGGNYHRIFSPLAVRLKCIQIIKWKPEVKTHTTLCVSSVNKGHIPQGSRTSLGSKNVLLNQQRLYKNTLMVTKHRETYQWRKRKKTKYKNGAERIINKWCMLSICL